MGKLWSWFIGLFKTAWFKAFLMFAIDKLKAILEQIGKEAYAKIVAKAIELGASSLTGPQKAKALVTFIKDLVPGIADSMVNYLIEAIVQNLKDQKLA